MKKPTLGVARPSELYDGVPVPGLHFVLLGGLQQVAGVGGGGGGVVPPVPPVPSVPVPRVMVPLLTAGLLPLQPPPLQAAHSAVLPLPPVVVSVLLLPLAAVSLLLPLAAVSVCPELPAVSLLTVVSPPPRPARPPAALRLGLVQQRRQGGQQERQPHVRAARCHRRLQRLGRGTIMSFYPNLKITILLFARQQPVMTRLVPTLFQSK